LPLYLLAAQAHLCERRPAPGSLARHDVAPDVTA